MVQIEIKNIEPCYKETVLVRDQLWTFPWGVALHKFGCIYILGLKFQVIIHNDRLLGRSIHVFVDLIKVISTEDVVQVDIILSSRQKNAYWPKLKGDCFKNFCFNCTIMSLIEAITRHIGDHISKKAQNFLLPFNIYFL